MGAYINPPIGVEKEQWLEENGKELIDPPAALIDGSDSMPVCLVSNGAFTAAAICFSEGELDEFKRNCGRLKRWFVVPKELMYEVSDLKSYTEPNYTEP